MIDGQSLLYRLRQKLNEDTSSTFIDDRTSYESLWQAAIEFASRTDSLHATQSITTAASQTNYDLNADFLKLYLKDTDGNYYLKYNDGTDNSFITFRDYEQIIHDDNTSSISIPSYFSLIDDSTQASRITGTCTSAGALSNGQATLTDSAGNFTNVNAGDMIHNTTDSAVGYVLSKTSTTVLMTAMFGGTDNDWDSSDGYSIQPQSRMQLVLDPPPSTAGHTITFYYVQRPAPVMSNFGVYRIPIHFTEALVDYAAWFYKYKDREPQFGDRFYQFFENEIRKARPLVNRAQGHQKWTVNMKKRTN